MSVLQTALSENAVLNFLISTTMVCAMVGSSFVTIFRLKFSDYL